jgi:hypothetical protein
MNAIAVPVRPLGTTPTYVGRRIRNTLGSSPEPSWAPRAREILENLAGLPIGWDGYDADPLTRESAQEALTFLAYHLGDDAILPEMTPIHGGIQLEWHRSSIDLEIELRSSEWTGFYRDGDDQWEGELGSNLARFLGVLDRVITPSGV